MSYHNLTNQEIVFLFYISKAIRDQYEDVSKNQSITQSIPTDWGVMKVETPIPSDFINEMLESKHYVYMKGINEKLLPIYEIIKDTEPEMVEEISEIFKPKLE